MKDPSRPPLPNVSVQQLDYLVAAVEAPTFAEAAADLGVSASALSQGLAELERRVGIDLFEADGRRRMLRPQAEEVLRYAERVLGQTADLARWAQAHREGRTGPLRVGLIDVAAVEHHPEALRAFRRARPDVDLRLTVAPSGELLDRLGRGSLDLAVCVDPEGAGFDAQPLLDEPMAVYAPDEARVGPPEHWGPWVSFPPGSQTRALIAAALRERGAPFEVVADSHQPEVLCEMVRLGIGWTVLPVVQAEKGPAALRRARPEVLVHRRLAAVRRADRPPDPAADALVTTLLDLGPAPPPAAAP